METVTTQLEGLNKEIAKIKEILREGIEKLEHPENEVQKQAFNVLSRFYYNNLFEIKNNVVSVRKHYFLVHREYIELTEYDPKKQTQYTIRKNVENAINKYLDDTINCLNKNTEKDLFSLESLRIEKIEISHYFLGLDTVSFNYYVCINI